MAVTVVGLPAGAGKTTAFAEKIAHANKAWRIEVYAPTHALAIEWKNLIQNFNPKCRVQVIGGRNHQTPGGKPLCSRYKIAAQISKAGQSVYTRLCRTSGGDQCQFYGECPYIEQFYGANVYIYTHAYLPLDRGLLDARVPELVVIDEAFFSVCLQKFEFDISLLQHNALPAVAVSICADIAANLQSGASLHPTISRTRKRGGGLRAAIEALRSSAPRPLPIHTDQQVAQKLQSAPNFEPVACLLEHLAQAFANKQVLQSVRYENATGLITVNHRRDITRFKPKSKSHKKPMIYLLDATTSRVITEVFFSGAGYKDTRVRRNAFVVQCRSTKCSTKSLDPARNSTPQSKSEAIKKLFEVQLLIDELSQGNKKVLVVGPTAITGNPANNLSPLVTVPLHCALAHFAALRGVDAWKEFDTVLVVGRNQPSTEAVEDMARSLFYDNPRPLKLSGSWTSEARGYRLGFGAEGIEVDVHLDRRVQAVLEQLRESESLQAIDRLRLIFCTEPKLVVLLSNVPLDIDVDALLSWDEIVHGSRIEQAFRQAGTVMPLFADWLSSEFPEFWKTKAAAKKDVSRGFKKGQFTNKYSIRKMSPFTFEYRAGGQRRWSHCISRVSDVATVKAALGGMLGQGVTVRGPVKPPPPQSP